MRGRETTSVRTTRHSVIISLLIGLNLGSAWALEVPSFFGDHAVLQRDAPIPVWGKAAAGAEVTVRLAGRTVTTTAADERWRVELPALEAGGPYELRITSGADELVSKDVLIGEVWVLAGQSNMRWPLGRTPTVEASEAIAEGDAHPWIRFFEPGYEAADAPKFDVKAGTKWLVGSAATAPRMPTVGYYFARQLAEAFDVPVGLVQTAVGGSKAETFLSREVLRNDERLSEVLAAFEREPAREKAKALANKKRPSGYYYSRVAPLLGFAARGVIWYQGESNASGTLPAFQRDTYGAQLDALVSSWREGWGKPDLPFLIVQLPAYGDEKFDLPFIRSMQERVARENENVGLAVGIDTGDEEDIHPADKGPIASRLADMAIGFVKTSAVVTGSPFFERADVEGREVVVAFDQVGGGLVNTQFTLDEFIAITRGTGPGELGLMGFEIAGADGRFVTAGAVIDGERVRVLAESVAEPKAVRYLWEGYPSAPVGLYTRSGYPVAPFRSELP